MTVFTLSQASALALGRMGPRERAGRSAPTRNGTTVRRGSIEAGTFEAAFFLMPARGETDRMLTVARRALDAGRRLRREARAGQRTLSASERMLTTLTGAAVRVYEEICTPARLNRGRVFLSYDHMAAATGLGRATVARGIAILEGLGFLVRQRRFRRIEGAGEGPRYKQASNAYRPTLATRVLAYLPRWLRPAPVPDDRLQRAADHDAEQAAMCAGLSCRDLARVSIDGTLGDMLARLGTVIPTFRHIGRATPCWRGGTPPQAIVRRKPGQTCGCLLCSAGGAVDDNPS